MLATMLVGMTAVAVRGCAWVARMGCGSSCCTQWPFSSCVRVCVCVCTRARARVFFRWV